MQDTTCGRMVIVNTWDYGKRLTLVYCVIYSCSGIFQDKGRVKASVLLVKALVGIRVHTTKIPHQLIWRIEIEVHIRSA